MRAWLLALVLCVVPVFAQAQVDDSTAPLRFSNAAEEQRFHALTSELRCVMCQNQSLADSNALVARDLRKEVLQLMHEGRNDGEIKQFLVQRYGEFVLYRPRMEERTWLLWFGPMLLVIAGALLVTVLVRRNANRARGSISTDEPQEW